MLPSSGYIDNSDDLVLDFVEDEQEQNQTFKLNAVENIIGGKIDEVAAVEQSIYLMLNIEADQYIIYPYTYGMKTLDLIGKPIHYVMAIIPERIEETLLSDDRITEVSDFEYEVDKNKLHVKFIAHTIYGEIEVKTVVIY